MIYYHSVIIAKERSFVYGMFRANRVIVTRFPGRHADRKAAAAEMR